MSFSKLSLFCSIFLFGAFLSDLSAQNKCVDALSNLNSKKVDTVYVNQILKVLPSYRETSPECASRVAHKIYTTSDSLKYKRGKILSLLFQFEMNSSSRKFPEASALLSKLVITIGSDSGSWIGKYAYLLAYYYDQRGIKDSALNLYHRSIELNNKLGNKDYEYLSYNKAGVIHLFEKDYTNAKSLFDRALSLTKEIEDTTVSSEVYINMGIYFGQKKEFNNALEYFKQGARVCSSANKRKGLASAYNNIASTYRFKKDFKRAEEYYMKSLEIHSEIDNKFGVAAAYNNLALFYFKTYQTQKAKKFYLKSLELAKKIESERIQKKTLFNLYKVHKANAEHEQALEYYTQYAKLNEKSFNEKKSEQIEEIKTRYETKEKENRIKLLDAKIEQATIVRNSIIVAASLFLGMLIVSVRAYVQKRKTNLVLTEKNIQIEKRDKEKALLLRELNHRVKNNLQIVSSLLNLQSSKIADETASEAVREGKARIEAMSLIHQKLYGERYYTKIDLNEYLSDLLKKLIYSFGKNIRLELDIDPVILDIDQTTPLALVVNELITNVIKYAYDGTSEPVLLVSAKEQEGGNLELLVKDNGLGFKEDFAEKPKASFGMRMIESLSRQLDGKISYYNDNGGVRHLVFPMNKQTNESQS